jgi:hypothetical protein
MMAKSHSSTGLWFRIALDFFDNHKAFTLSVNERELYLRAIAYSRRQLTDGLLTRDTLCQLGIQLAAHVCHCVRADRSIVKVCDDWIDNLYRAGLLDKIDEQFFQIHDYLDWNTSKEHVLSIKEIRSISGRKGGRPKQNANQFASGKSNLLTKLVSKTEAKPNPEFRVQSSENKDKDKEIKSSEGGKLPLASQQGEPLCKVEVLPKPDKESPTKATRERYAVAYQAKYGVEPLWNASTNGQMAAFVKAVGKEVAPALAEFYVQLNSNAYYTQQRHPVSALLKDCTGLHTQMMSGVIATRNEAKSAEKRQDAQSQFQRLMGGTANASGIRKPGSLASTPRSLNDHGAATRRHDDPVDPGSAQ